MSNTIAITAKDLKPGDLFRPKATVTEWHEFIEFLPNSRLPHHVLIKSVMGGFKAQIYKHENAQLLVVRGRRTHDQ